MKKFLLSLLCLFASVLTFAQSGEVSGKVTDLDTGEGLPFANVYIQVDGVPRGAQTDFDGFYSIKPIPPGDYMVTVEYLGYQTQKIDGVQINADQVRILDVKLAEESELLEEVLIVAYTVPLIEDDKGNTTTVTSKDIGNLATRSVATIATTSSGVYGEDGSDDLNIKGSRDNATQIIVDGVKVRGNATLPASAIEQMSIVTGGIPAKYGDATGGIITITTRGATSDFNGGIELITSQGLDRFEHNFASGSLSGPLLKLKRKGTDLKRSVMGFFIAGEIETNKDNDAPAIDIYRVKDEVYDDLITNPLQPATNGAGYVKAVDFITPEDLEQISTREGVRHLAVNVAGNITISPSDNIDIRIGGSGSYDNDGTPFRSYEMFNELHHRKIVDQAYRGYVRFSQRFGSQYASEEQEENPSVFSNAFYSLQYDYTKSLYKGEDPVHGDNYFDYGHVGNFSTDQQAGYRSGFMELKDENGTFNFVNEVDGNVLNFASNYIYLGDQDNGVTFDGSNSANPIQAAQTQQYLDLTAGNALASLNVDQIFAGNGLINGSRGTSGSTAHSMFYMPGVVYPFNFLFDNEQHRLLFNGSVDFKKRGASDRNKHAIEFGVELEQRIDRYYELNAIGLWDRIRQSVSQRGTSGDIQLDLANPYFIINGERILVTDYDESVHGAFDQNDTITYDYVRVNEGSFFDNALRTKLGAGSTDYVDFFGINPDDLSMNMFSADDLFGTGGGDNIVDYYGYDHKGQRLDYQPSFEDFFKSKSSFTALDGSSVDYFDRPMGAFRPIYIAGYVQDKFIYKDLIFNVGVRVDRFDSNQKVRKDKYSLYGVRSVGETLQDGQYRIGNTTYTVPETIGDDFVVYVNSADNPTALNGFRNGDVWYNSNGEEVADPDVLSTSGNIFPYLADASPSGSDIKSEDFDINSAFEDYTPEINVMPRVAVSFKMNENASFFAHYNVLTQRPYSRNFAGPDDYYFFEERAILETFNNSNLKSEKTIGFEIGFRQALSTKSAITLSAYYKEIRDLIQVQTIRFAYPREYTTYENLDFATVKGFEIGFDQRRTGNVRFTANYNLAFAEGTGSGDRSGANLAASGQPNLRTLIPLDYDARHTLNVTFDYRFGEGSKYNGPMLKNWKILENAGANVIFTGRTGTPYTRQNVATPDQLIGVAGRSSLEGGINGSRLPATFRFDLKVDKDWKFGKGNKAKYLNTYVLVQNLLDTKNIVNVYSFTNSPVDDGYLQTQESNSLSEEARALYNIAQQNPNNYSLPRRLRLGASFTF